MGEGRGRIARGDACGAVIIASTLLNAGYFLPIVYRAFFVAPPADDHGHGHSHGEAPLPMVLAELALDIELGKKIEVTTAPGTGWRGAALSSEPAGPLSSNEGSSDSATFMRKVAEPTRSRSMRARSSAGRGASASSRR